jgi:hypothetical protein
MTAPPTLRMVEPGPKPKHISEILAAYLKQLRERAG